MSTREPRRPLTARTVGLSLAGAAVAIVLLWALFHAAGEDAVAAGVVVGGVGFLVFAAIALWRALRRPGSSGTPGRALAGRTDERDKAIVAGAFTWTGYVATGCLVVSTIAVALGADPLQVLRLVTIAVNATLVGAFVVLIRRT